MEQNQFKIAIIQMAYCLKRGVRVVVDNFEVGLVEASGKVSLCCSNSHGIGNSLSQRPCKYPELAQSLIKHEVSEIKTEMVELGRHWIWH